jgi:preprotein translocase SecF subunit
MALPDILNRSINQTLARTTMTSATTLLALLALYFFGGDIIHDFVLAMIWGVFVGTYSSIFVAVPLLIKLNLRRDFSEDTGSSGEGSPA